ncbi:MAG: enoyl-[acyl-carrier-protein] reductase FabK [Bacteroidales bacterium]|jgi:enoyl-[acyl-carrier protein] reductase II|nr:enoyl-[acyl-carrier-protein] reductase FabK [Bacteroidales bacterium]MBP5705279.1 enoyl-[acyl-carrier-protein] reductase FabK [Paludibacteraceae bacterium]MEE1085523.1 enoyl-[acyl-carrier-protein] reductase FabK [Paludibacteraceae bacterium]
MIKSKICDLLGIKYPIIQGGMAWVADASLAAAVSNAGGLGIITGACPPDIVREEIRKCKQMTDKPFGVNIMLQAPEVEKIAQIVVEEGVKILTTGAGSPAPFMEMWKAAGIKVIPVVASVALALRIERMGVDAIIAEGAESGGHTGEANTLPLVPQIVDAVNVPVIAAGGIGDGRGMAAAFMLGAEAVQCGTCFLVADECTVHEVYKEKVLKAGDNDTIVTGKKLGHPVRTVRTPFSKSFAKMENDPNVTSEELLQFGAGSLRKAVKDGNLKEGSFMAGEIAGMINEKKSCKEIVEGMASKCEELLKAANSRLA